MLEAPCSQPFSSTPSVLQLPLYFWTFLQLPFVNLVLALHLRFCRCWLYFWIDLLYCFGCSTMMVGWSSGFLLLFSGLLQCPLLLMLLLYLHLNLWTFCLVVLHPLQHIWNKKVEREKYSIYSENVRSQDSDVAKLFHEHNCESCSPGCCFWSPSAWGLKKKRRLLALLLLPLSLPSFALPPLLFLPWAFLIVFVIIRGRRLWVLALIFGSTFVFFNLELRISPNASLCLQKIKSR